MSASASTLGINLPHRDEVAVEEMADTQALPFWVNKHAPNRKMYKTATRTYSTFKPRATMQKSVSNLSRPKNQMFDEKKNVEMLNTWKEDKFLVRETVAQSAAKHLNSSTKHDQAKSLTIHKQRMNNYFTIAGRILRSKTDNLGESSIGIDGIFKEFSKPFNRLDLTDEELVIKNIVKRKLVLPGTMEETITDNTYMEQFKKDSKNASLHLVNSFKEMRKKFPQIAALGSQCDRIYQAIVRDKTLEVQPSTIAVRSSKKSIDSVFAVNWIEMFYKFHKQLVIMDAKLSGIEGSKPLEEGDFNKNPYRFSIDSKIDIVIFL